MYGGIILGPKHFEQIQMFCFGSIRCPFSFGQDPQVEQGYHLPTKKFTVSLSHNEASKSKEIRVFSALISTAAFAISSLS